MSFDSSSDPYDTVVYITDTIGSETLQGSGVLISPDEVLTASHVVYSSQLGPANVASISVTPAYAAGLAPFGSASAANFHYSPIFDPNDTISTAQSQFDYAVIHLSQSFDVGSMGLQAGFAGGAVNVTGYPVSGNGLMVSSQQIVVQDPNYTVLDGSTIGARIERRPGLDYRGGRSARCRRDRVQRRGRSGAGHVRADHERGGRSDRGLGPKGRRHGHSAEQPQPLRRADRLSHQLGAW